MKVALVHDWLIHMRGGEKVLDALAELFPEATLYTLFFDRKRISPNLARLKIKASFLQYLPGIKAYYRWLLPILPWAIRSLKIEDADLVISSSHCVAKGIRIPEGARHICYCHTPMRYLWGFQDVYFERYPAPVRALMEFVFQHLRAWDLDTNKHVDLFVANSEFIKARIRAVYGRESVVVHPPLETGFFKPAPEEARNDVKRDPSMSPSDSLGMPGAEQHGSEHFFLAVSHFVPYKRIDLVIEAFNALDRRLVVIGSGPLAAQYQKLRKSERISFVGSVSDEELRKAYQGARALIFPAEEDFGIVPLEAQACGAPVIAFQKGGALETVKSGVFFEEQAPEAIRKAVERFEDEHYDRGEVSRKVREFGREFFLKNMKTVLERFLSEKTVKS